LRLLPWGAAPLLIAPRAGRLADQIGDRPLILSGLALQSAALAWIAIIAAPQVSYAAIVAPLFISGAGLGLAIPRSPRRSSARCHPATSAGVGRLQHDAPARRRVRGRHPAAVFTAAGSYSSAGAFSRGFAPAMAAAAGLALAGGLAALALPGRPNRIQTAPADDLIDVTGIP